MRRAAVVCVQELRDRNDELSSELELLTSQRSNRKSRRASGGDAAAAAVLNWTQPALSASVESDSGKHQHRACVSVCVSLLSNQSG